MFSLRIVQAAALPLLVACAFATPASAIRNGTPESGSRLNGVGMFQPGAGHPLGTGTMLNSFVVLTAAQNVRGPSPDPLVHEFTLGPGMTAHATEVRIHPQFDTAEGINLAYDIALAALDPDEVRNWPAVARPLILDQRAPVASPVVGVGFGDTQTGAGSGQRRSGSFFVNGYVDGADALGLPIPNAFIEVLPANTLNQCMCPGDQGGPLFYNDQVVGISSFRYVATCDEEGPGYYLSLHRFTDWIRDNLRDIEPPQGKIVFNGYANALPGAGGSVVWADWSSDFGSDFRAYPSGEGNIGGTTTPTTWSDGSFHKNESITLDVQRSGFVNAGSQEYLHATGEITIGAGGFVSPDVVHRYRIDNIAYNPHNALGLGDSGKLEGTFDFSGVSVSSPLHWAASWQIDIVNPGATYFLNTSQIVVQVDGSDIVRIPAGRLPASQTMTGEAFGTTFGSQIVFYAESSVLGGGTLGEARVTLDLKIRFSEEPFARPGDFNTDGSVNAADYVVWRKNAGTQGDYNTWRSNFGRTTGSGMASSARLAPGDSPWANSVPEPLSAWLLIFAAIAGNWMRSRIAS